MGSTISVRKSPNFPCYCFGCSYEELLDYIDAHCKVESPLKKCPGIINYKMLKRLWEPGSLYIDFCNEVVRAWACFTCFTFSLIGQELVFPLWCWCGCWGLCVCCFVWFALFDVSGLSFRSRCLTMTTLAQLHDCHGCNDERSIVQKKILFTGRISAIVIDYLLKYV